WAWREYDQSEHRDRHKLVDRAFGDLWAGPSGNVPALMLLTTDVASGRRVAVSHLAIPKVTKTESTNEAGAKDTKMQPANDTGAERKCVQPDPNEKLESRVRLLTLDELVTPPIEVSAATAAILSARFPGVTAAGRLPCSGNTHRLVDGGYFE